MGSSRDISEEVNAKQAEDKTEADIRQILNKHLGPGFYSPVAVEIMEYYSTGPGSGYVNQD